MWFKEPEILEKKITDVKAELANAQEELTEFKTKYPITKPKKKRGDKTTQPTTKQANSTTPTSLPTVLTHLETLEVLERKVTTFKTKITKLQNQQIHLPKHHNLITHQREYEKQQKESAAVGTVFIQIDFVGFEFQNGKCDMQYVNDLVVVMEIKEEKADKTIAWRRCYFDFLCSDKFTCKNDFHYVRSTLQWLHENGFFDNCPEIIMSSDNAGKHFKNCYTFEWLVAFSVKIGKDILWIMYSPNHGWGLCDSHGGILSQKVHTAILNGKAPNTAKKMQELINETPFTLSDPYPVVFEVSQNLYLFSIF